MRGAAALNWPLEYTDKGAERNRRYGAENALDGDLSKANAYGLGERWRLGILARKTGGF